MADQKEKEDDKDQEEPEAKPEPKPEPKVREDDDGNVTVELTPKPPRPSRRERREENYEELRRYRDEAEALRARVASMEAQMHARVQAVEQRIPTGDDPYEQKLSQIRGQQELIQAALRTGSINDPQEVDRLRKQYYALDSETRRLDREKITEEVTAKVRQSSAPRAGDYEEAALRNEFPDVIGHPTAMRYATGTYYQLVAEGKPPTLTTSREAMVKAAERFGLRQAPPPVASPSMRQKLSAVPAQAGTKNPGEVRLDASQKKMAVARWPQLDEHQAYTRMAALLQKADSDAAAE